MSGTVHRHRASEGQVKLYMTMGKFGITINNGLKQEDAISYSTILFCDEEPEM